MNTSAAKALQSQATALFGTKALSLDITAEAHAERARDTEIPAAIRDIQDDR